jgi:uncharacterized small protein (DUF1192 family)
MSEISNRTKDVRAKLLKIADKMMALQGENDRLKQDLTVAKSGLTEKETRIAALTEDFNRIKLARTVVTASGDKAEMKFRVNEMVKEIDKCIALLNR